jgi:predicted dehydrogenase
MTVLRVGVVGGGLITQAVHLPALCALAEHFAVVAIAEPSPAVATALAARCGARPYARWEELLEHVGLDAVIVCSPNHTHAAIVLAALDRGLDVFVEKPLCLDPADAQRIVARQARTGRVVQVGYMKRFDPAYASLIDGIAGHAETLRMIETTTVDPGMAREPFVPWSQMVSGRDVPAEVVRAGRSSEAAQVAAATGCEDPVAARAYADVFLGALIHDVNLVHGALESLGLALPAMPVAAASWSGATAASVTLEVGDQLRWHSSWLLLPAVEHFRERVRLYFDDAVHAVDFDAPYFTQVAAVHEVTRRGAAGGVRVERRARVLDSYRAELRHFHACVTEGVRCRTDARQASADVVALRDLFVLARTPAQPPAVGIAGGAR